MPFIDSSQSFKSKAHLSKVSTPVLVGLVLVVLLAAALAVENVLQFGAADFGIQKNDAAEVLVSESEEGQSEGSGDGQGEAVSDASRVVVFVSGCVQEPGVYSLPEGSRVQDAINLAQGFSEDASTDALNLARVLQDGEQIDVPSQEEVDSGAAGAQGSAEGAASQDTSQGSGLVNINSASLSELESLPGIGSVTAQKIIDDREAQGPFSSKEDLKRVSGIGDKKYEALEDLITV